MFPAMVDSARQRGAGLCNVRWIRADLRDLRAPAAGYDAVVAIASRHHLPLEPALAQLAALVAPGGVLAVLGLARPDGALDLLWASAAYPANWAVAGWKAVLGRRDPPDDSMPVTEPATGFSTISAVAGRLLPGAVLRRHLFFRYSLVWHRPLNLT